MNEEEKKAIKEVEHFKELTRYWQEEEYEEKEIAGYITIILNLIEKQAKEIEKLEQNNIDKDFIIDGLREERRLAAEEIQEHYFVSKDEIQEKIEEINDEFNYRNSYEEDFNYKYGEVYAFAEEKLKELLNNE